MDYFNFLLPIITAIIGSYLTFYFTNRSKRNEAILKYKEEKYSKLLIKLQGFVGITANNKTKREFFEEQYQSWLYCSDDVVIAINRMVDIIMIEKGNIPNPEEGRKAIGNIVLAMRKDLLGKTSLEYKDFRYINVIDKD